MNERRRNKHVKTAEGTDHSLFELTRRKQLRPVDCLQNILPVKRFADIEIRFHSHGVDICILMPGNVDQNYFRIERTKLFTQINAAHFWHFYVQ